MLRLPRKSCQRPAACALVLLAPMLVMAAAAAEDVDIATELDRLKATYGFTVTGEEHLEDASGRAEGGDVYRRLRVLLRRFDHIIVQDPAGRIERVLIVGPTNPAAAPSTVVEVDEPAEEDGAQQIELPTTRDGNQHSVEVTLEGAEGRRLKRMLLIDTGADAVVLPVSMIAALGIAEERLSPRDVQTANGTTEALMGKLPAVWLDGQRVGEVEVAFLEDDKLSADGLLGMSVLGRYQMTIDDEHDRLTLTRR